MAKKKKKFAVSTLQADTAQVQNALANYHTVVKNLRKSGSRKQAQEALEEINRLPEPAQVALAKALGREQHTDAADLLVGINELGSQKNARKEAKRSLIQLESHRIYPNWRPPVEEHITSLAPTSAPLRRFWKGLISDTMAIGQVQLVLSWEQGAGYRRVLAFIFVLDFKGGGVEGFVAMQDERKDDFEATAAGVARSIGAPFKECSLAQGRSLLKRALAINEESGTKLPVDYRHNLPLIRELVLDVPGLEDEEVDLDFLEEDEDEEEEEEELDLSGLEPTAVVTNFVDYWAKDDYDIAYRLLSSDSPLREGLTEEEWDDRRYAWAEKYDAGELKPDFAEEREAPRSRLWLPRGAGGKGDENVKVVEAGWSIELDESVSSEEAQAVSAGEAAEELPVGGVRAGEEDSGEVPEEETPAIDGLPELPTPSLIFEESGRRWFWASYTLVKDQGEWRIQSITDEVAQVRQLSTLDLRARIDESNKQLNELTSKRSGLAKKLRSEEAMLSFLSTMVTRLMRLCYYLDALIERGAEVDLELLQEVVGVLALLNKQERALAYLEYVARRSEELRIANLGITADTRRLLARQYDEQGYEERAERFREKAEQELRELLAIKDDAETHISFVELLLDSDRLDEAEEHLLLAREMTSDPAEQAHIELHLGQIAEERLLYEEAVGHYQRVTELQPNQASSWVNLAKAYAGLGNQQQAENHFRHAIELNPANVDSYYEMSDMFEKSGQPERAIEILEEGLDANPDSTELTISLATLYIQREDYEQAEIFVERLGQLDPEYPALTLMRDSLAILRSTRLSARGKSIGPKLGLPKLPGQSKKRQSHTPH